MKHRNLAIACVLALMVFGGTVYLLLPSGYDRHGHPSGFYVSKALFDFQTEHGAFPEDFRDVQPHLQRALPRRVVRIQKIGDHEYQVTLSSPHEKVEFKVEYKLNRPT